MSKYCVKLLIFPSSTLMTWHAWQIDPLVRRGDCSVGVYRGPVCVPFQTTSMMAVSPLACSLTNVALESGIALAQPCPDAVSGERFLHEQTSSRPRSAAPH
jgi:hypothetical protein